MNTEDTQEKKTGIFLSHSWKDKEFVLALAKDLESAGARVWVDNAEIKVGDSLITKIQEGIDEMDFLAVVLSKTSVNSEWVKREVEIALTQEIKGKRVKVLPLLLDDCEIPGFLSMKLKAKFINPDEYQDSLELLLNSLELKPQMQRSNEIEKIARVESLANSGKSPSEIFETLEKATDGLLGDLRRFCDGILSNRKAYEWADEFKDQVEQIEKKWAERRFQIAVMALVKSGKSTLLNSWIGDEYLPSGAVAETMRIIRIKHNPQRKVGALIENEEVLDRGPENIRKHVRTLNTKARKLSKTERETELKLEVKLAALKGKSLRGYGFDILDTPGFNESGVVSLQAKVERIAKQCDVIIYLLDFTKLKTKDEELMLQNLKEWRVEMIEQLRSRIFFVVNKFDMINRHDREKGMDDGATRIYVKNILEKALNIPISAEDVIVMSAEEALLGRMIQAKKASKEQQNDFMTTAFGKYQKREKSEEEINEAALEMIKDSGFAELEEKVINVIYKKRSQIFFSALFDDILRHVGQTKKNLSIAAGALVADKDRVEQLKVDISTIRKQLDSFSLGFQHFKKKAQAIVALEYKNFSNMVNFEVRRVFADNASIYPWIKRKSGIMQGEDFVITGTDQSTVMERFRILHRRVIPSIEQRFDLMWNKMLEDLQGNFNAHRLELEKKAGPITQKVEEAINETLNIELEPMPVSFNHPTFDDFYGNTTYYLDELLQTESIANMSFWARQWNWFLNLFDAGEQVIWTDHFEISYREYLNYIRKELKPHADESRNLIGQVVEKQFLDAIKDATAELEEFVDRYISILSTQIEVRGAGDINIPERTAQIEAEIEQAQEVLDFANEINLRTIN